MLAFVLAACPDDTAPAPTTSTTTPSPRIATTPPSDGTDAEPACAGLSSQRDACEGAVALIRSYLSAIEWDRADNSESYQSYGTKIENVVQNFFTPDGQRAFEFTTALTAAINVHDEIDVTILGIRPTRNEEWSDEVAYVQYEATMEQHLISGATKQVFCFRSTTDAVVRKNNVPMADVWRIDRLLPSGAPG